MEIIQYLGQPASNLLATEPFNKWTVERSLDNDSDPPEVRYIFKGCGLEVNCSRDKEFINTFFFDKEKHAGVEFFDMSFDLNREEIRSKIGLPSKSGEGFLDPILGEYGPWDRFKKADYTVHIQYCLESSSVVRVTIMSNDVVPVPSKNSDDEE